MWFPYILVLRVEKANWGAVKNLICRLIVRPRYLLLLDSLKCSGAREESGERRRVEEARSAVVIIPISHIRRRFLI